MSDRIDLFTTIHKGLRWWLGDLSARLGALDLADPIEAARLASELIECLDTLDAHSEHEETFIAPLLDARGAGRTVDWHAEHTSLDAMASALRRQAGGLTSLQLPDPQRAGTVLELYRSLCRFASAVYLHLDDEETRLMPLLWATSSDEELAGVMSAFRARHSEESARLYARVAAAFTPRERALLEV